MELGGNLMVRFSVGFAALTVASTMLVAAPVRAADPTGIWLSADGDVKMKVAHCRAGICSTIAWLKAPNDAHGKPKTDKNNPDPGRRGRPIMGAPIILGMKADGPNKWSGHIYNAEDGKTYSGSFTLTGANTAGLKGCVAIICKTKAWTRSR
jgi:uncharacterized protein (DUF2147 family)